MTIDATGLAACPQVPTARARNFALRGVAWSLGLFGLMRLGWIEAHAVLPLTQLQSRIAQAGFGAPVVPINVTLACSGADAVALCAGAILAYPAGWPARIAGAAGGIALILGLNTVRIGTLGRAAASPFWFQALHIYVWPALLTLAIAAYVFTWMRRAEKVPEREKAPGASRSLFPFVALTVALMVIFVAAAPFYLESAGVLAVAGFIARAAAVTLRTMGVQAAATANVLNTSRGAFLVTQECISTPLIPVYVAAVFAFLASWRARALALLAALPLFIALGIARLLVVALPAALIGSPLFLIHAFYQLLLAAVVVCVAACWRHGSGATAWHRALAGGVLGAALAYGLAPLYTHVLTWAFGVRVPLEDPQGAIALLPGFQVGLYAALSVAAFIVFKWRSFVTGLAMLGLSQIAVFAALYVVVRYAGLTPHVRDVRAWAVAAPLLVIAAMVTHERARH